MRWGNESTHRMFTNPICMPDPKENSGLIHSETHLKLINEYTTEFSKENSSINSNPLLLMLFQFDTER